ncbi:unnamed protein product [Rotaria sp. Silwood1]|nr:unnamed protein product [Rotaria sp. Silwood1]CAF4927654.1 unnamed protein product [Rotaria sp. Silwood1]CAF4938657.1 unnamed protein product [Rotaria sp. Silwood1]CAF5020362.1 unnamed protein product [Rotaria sp. Silwood1]
MRSPTIPKSVHELRPGDIQCVAAMGDSLTAGLGAKAKTPIGLVTEYRGVAWSVGGDDTFEKTVTLPNILRLYNPQLKGFSTKTSIAVLNGQNAKNNRLNIGKTGSDSYNMDEQADILLYRIKNEGLCDWSNDWKLITVFIGANDLCDFCDESMEYDPPHYVERVRGALDKLYYANLSRTLINLVPVLNVSFSKELKDGNIVCGLLQKSSCPCAAYPTQEQENILKDWIPGYQTGLDDLVKTRRYDGRDDFTVVVQPFFTHTQPPQEKKGGIDFSYFAPDCFHLSAKGHAVAALSLWNNMFEAVGTKKTSWHEGEPFECPTEDHPYIYTWKNSISK